MEFACSPCGCVGVLWVLQSGQLNILKLVCLCMCTATVWEPVLVFSVQHSSSVWDYALVKLDNVLICLQIFFQFPPLIEARCAMLLMFSKI